MVAAAAVAPAPIPATKDVTVDEGGWTAEEMRLSTTSGHATSWRGLRVFGQSVSVSTGTMAAEGDRNNLRNWFDNWREGVSLPSHSHRTRLHEQRLSRSLLWHFLSSALFGPANQGVCSFSGYGAASDLCVLLPSRRAYGWWQQQQFIIPAARLAGAPWETLKPIDRRNRTKRQG